MVRSSNVSSGWYSSTLGSCIGRHSGECRGLSVRNSNSLRSRSCIAAVVSSCPGARNSTATVNDVVNLAEYNCYCRIAKVRSSNVSSGWYSSTLGSCIGRHSGECRGLSVRNSNSLRSRSCIAAVVSSCPGARNSTATVNDVVNLAEYNCYCRIAKVRSSNVSSGWYSSTLGSCIGRHSGECRGLSVRNSNSLRSRSCIAAVVSSCPGARNSTATVNDVVNLAEYNCYCRIAKVRSSNVSSGWYSSTLGSCIGRHSGECRGLSSVTVIV